MYIYIFIININISHLGHHCWYWWGGTWAHLIRLWERQTKQIGDDNVSVFVAMGDSSLNMNFFHMSNGNMWCVLVTVSVSGHVGDRSKTASLHDSGTKVRSSSFDPPPPPLHSVADDILLNKGSLCVLNVSGFPGPGADATSQMSLVHTTYQQAWASRGRGGERSFVTDSKQHLCSMMLSYPLGEMEGVVFFAVNHQQDKWI